MLTLPMNVLYARKQDHDRWGRFIHRWCDSSTYTQKNKLLRHGKLSFVSKQTSQQEKLCHDKGKPTCVVPTKILLDVMIRFPDATCIFHGATRSCHDLTIFPKYFSVWIRPALYGFKGLDTLSISWTKVGHLMIFARTLRTKFCSLSKFVGS